MIVKFSSDARKEFDIIIKSNNNKMINRKISLVESIETNPYSGISKPEPLKY
jgi:Txe/YoeB family toxin of Txe-Axe toxin-antitoxin module